MKTRIKILTRHDLGIGKAIMMERKCKKIMKEKVDVNLVKGLGLGIALYSS